MGGGFCALISGYASGGDNTEGWNPTPSGGTIPWRSCAICLPGCTAVMSVAAALSLNLATRSAFGGAALVDRMFVETFSGSSFTGVPLAGDLWEWRSNETIPQRGVGWEADTPRMILFSEIL